MADRQRDQWTAFLLSLAAPGAGQLWSGRWTCLGYFAAVGCVASAAPGIVPSWVRWVGLAWLALVSAGRAKRGEEFGGGRRQGRAAGGAAVRSRVIDRSGRWPSIDMRLEVDVPRPRVEVWGMVADLPRFVTVDPFHSQVIVLGPALRPGVALALEHHAFGVRFLRFGRLLRWDEGEGYAFSDLSSRGGGLGFFPHVFFIRVEPDATGRASRARLTLTVRGKWTSGRVPRWLGRCWLRYVCREHARLLRAALV